MTRLAHPFGPGPSGRSATVVYGSAEHVQDCLQLVILTGPGERVMRRDFGSPLRQMLFSAGNGALGVTLEATLRAAILQWLGHLLVLDGLEVGFDEGNAAMTVEVTYRVLLTGEDRVLTVTQGVG